MIPDYNSISDRYVYNVNLAHLAAKPHQAVVERINHNRMIAPNVRRAISAGTVRQSAARIGPGQPISGPQASQRVQKLSVTGRIVPESMVHRPGSEVQFVRRSLKGQPKRPQVRPAFQRSRKPVPRPESASTSRMLKKD